MTISEQYAFLIRAQHYARSRGDTNWASHNIYLQTSDGRTLGEAVWNTLEFLYGAEVADQLQG